MMLFGRTNAQVAVNAAAVSATDHVVDIGCGPGNAVRAAARRGARVTGIDPASVMLRVARVATRSRAAITWAAGTAESLPLSDRSATIVWSVATVHHWKDVDRGLAEAYRVLAPGGRFLTIERRVQPGATGLASRGWTKQQAESFASLCRTRGFGTVRVDTRGTGRRAVWAVSGVRP